MSENKISQKILATIKEKHIKPKPKWEFLLKSYLIWTLFGFCLVVGALSASVVIYLLVNNDWDLYRYASGSFFEFFFITLPYFWLFIFVLFIAVAYYNFKHTKKGYLTSLGKVIGICLFLSFLLGGLIYAAGFGKMLDNALSENFSYYNDFLEHRRQIWNQPGKGMLAGTIIKIESERFNLLDLIGEERCVDCLNKHICNLAEINIGKNVKVLGESVESECFKGRLLRVWREGMPDLGNCPYENKMFFRKISP